MDADVRRVSWWLRLLGYRPADAKGLKVLLFTRAGCHLCEEADAFLEAEAKRYGFELVKIDVDIAAEAGLAERYGAEVPVVQVGERVRFRGRINRALWERLMQAEIRKLRFRRASAAPEEPAS